MEKSDAAKEQAAIEERMKHKAVRWVAAIHRMKYVYIG
jgi:hypothetical protein